MSIISVVDEANFTISAEGLHRIAAAHGIKISKSEDEEDYLLYLNAIDATVEHIQSLPAYVDPRLKPDPATFHADGYARPAVNPLNAWSHQYASPRKVPEEDETNSRTSQILRGKTIAFKDNTCTAGLPLTIGTFPTFFEGDKYPIATIDAVVVRRALEAGAKAKGTATCENYSLSPLSFGSATGPVHNPWLTGYVVGGSSSGGAALVGISQIKTWRARHGLDPLRDDELGEGVDMAIGGDQGGSIRIPAAYAGIYGLKPTHGLIPYTGIASLHPMVDHTGPLTTSLEDCADLLTALAGYDGLDPRMTPESPLRHAVPDYGANLARFISEKQATGLWACQTAGRGLKIGILTEAFTGPDLSPSMLRPVEAAISRFRTLGATLIPISIPLHIDGGPIWTLCHRAQMIPFLLANQPPPFHSHPIPNLRPKPPDQAAYELLTAHNPAVVNTLFNHAHLASRPDAAAVTAKAHLHALELRAAYDKALEEVDVLVAPVNPRVGAPNPRPGARVSELMKEAIGSTRNTCPFNVTGHPALSLPVGFGRTEDGRGWLPVGMQIVGPRWGERVVLEVAKVWEVAGVGLDTGEGVEEMVEFLRGR